MANQDQKAQSYPEPKLPKRGRRSKYNGARFIANPGLNGQNPREPGSAGHVFHELIRQAGADGITYEELKAAAKGTTAEKVFSLHIKYEVEEKFFTVIKK